MKVLILGVAAGVLLATGPAYAARPIARPEAAAAQKSPAQHAAQVLLDAAKALDDGADDRAFALLEQLTGSEDFESLPPETRRLGWYLLGLAGLRTDHYEVAHEALKKSSRMAGATNFDWILRMYAAREVHDVPDAVESLVALGLEFPANVRTLDQDTVQSLLASTIGRQDGPELRFKVQDTLFEAEWSPPRSAFDPSALWRDYAAALLDRGQTERAGRAAALVTGVRDRIAMRADKRFDPIMRLITGPFDIRAAGEVELAAARARAEAAPKSLQGQIDLAQALASLDRREEGIAVLDDAITRIRAAKASGVRDKPFDDDDDNLIWALNTKAYMLLRLKRDEEGLAVMTDAARRPESGQVNTSQALNLASIYVRMGRPHDALKWIAGVESMSDYGKGVMLNNSICAKVQLGDQTGAARDLVELRKLIIAIPGAVEDALICMNDPDGAAKMLIDRLAKPDTRLDALLDIQDYRPSSYGWSFETEMDRRRDLIRQRPDVQAEIDRVGHRDHYDFWP